MTLVAQPMLGHINRFKTGTISTSSSHVTGLEPGNLASDQCDPSLGWQTADGILTSAAGASLRVDLDTSDDWQLFGIGKTNLTSAATVNFAGFQASDDSLLWSTSVGGPVRGYGQVIAVLSTPQAADYVRIRINDATNPDNNISVGWAFAGLGWQPAEIGLSRQSTNYQFVPNRRETKTRGGQRYIQPFYNERVWAMGLDAVRDDEAWDDLAEVLRVANLGVNILFVPNINSTETFRESVFGVLDSTKPIDFASGAQQRRAWAGLITERN